MDKNLCQICGAVPTAFIRSFASHPFADGRTYSLICWTCACVPKYYYTDNNGEIVYLENPDPDHLRTLEEMLEDGWEKAEAEYSINAIQKKLKKTKITIGSDHQHIYAQLFLENTKEMILNI